MHGLALLAHWSVRQKLNRDSSLQLSSVTSLCTRLKSWVDSCFWTCRDAARRSRGATNSRDTAAAQ